MYVYFQIPLGVMLLFPTLQGIKEELKQAISYLELVVLNSGDMLDLPIILPGIVGVFSILFANAMGAYASAYALVGSNYNLLTVQIGGLISGEYISQGRNLQVQ